MPTTASYRSSTSCASDFPFPLPPPLPWRTMAPATRAARDDEDGVEAGGSRKASATEGAMAATASASASATINDGRCIGCR